MNARAGFPLGVVHAMAIDEYHSQPGVSNSGLNDFAKSALHYHARHLNPDRPPQEPRSGQLEGNLAHCLVLESELFMDRYAVGPGNDRRLKEWKAWEASPRPAGVQCIKRAEYEVAKAQALSVRSIPDVAVLLAKGQPEVSAFWIDPASGELCRCRPDWVHPTGDNGVILLDLKTCADASPREFGRQVARKGYHRQAAFYSAGYQHASGLAVLGFVFVAVENEWPFASSATMLDDASLAQGRAELAELLPRYAACRERNVWPGYGDSIGLITLPAWALIDESMT